MKDPIVYHIPVCPFCQRVEILLTLKGRRADVDFSMVDVTRPRPAWLMEKTRGSTALPVLETAEGRIIKESLVILEYLEAICPGPPVAQRDPYRRAVEGMMTSMEGGFASRGYQWVLNQDPARREAFRSDMLAQYAALDAFLLEHAPHGTWLFDTFGWAEAVFTPLFQRFWFLEYYEGFELPDERRFDRVRRWVDACISHPAAQQVSREEVIKLYYDYAKGAGNGAVLPGRDRSSFSMQPDWRARPWPPGNKYEHSASDEELGLG